jgi:BMFP domain-containing protein YqiC
LNLPTRDEVEKLKKRLTQLEKRLDEIAGSKAA